MLAQQAISPDTLMSHYEVVFSQTLKWVCAKSLIRLFRQELMLTQSSPILGGRSESAYRRAK